MTTKTNSAEGGTNSATVTPGNSGGASGDAFNTVGGSPTFVNTPTLVGGMAYVIPAANDLLWWTGFGTAVGKLRFAFRLSANTGLSGLRLCEIRTGSRSLARVFFNASNQLVLTANNNGTTIGTLSTTVPSVDTLYVMDIVAESKNSGNATVKARWFAASDPSTIIGQQSSSTVSQGTTANATTRTVGRGASDSYGGVVYLDQIEANDDTANLDYIGMWSIPITESLTDSLALIEATDGTPPFTIAQDSGATTTPEELDDGAVSGTGRWLVAKHATDTLVYTITDDAAVESDPVNVPPAATGNSTRRRPDPDGDPTDWL